MRDPSELQKSFEHCLGKARSYEGSLWREVQAEIQAGHGEIPFWVLLYEDSDLPTCHKAFVDAVKPLMDDFEPMQVTVAYKIFKDGLEVTIDTLMDNDEVIEALDGPSLGTMPDVAKLEGPNVFRATESGLAPKENP